MASPVLSAILDMDMTRRQKYALHARYQIAKIAVRILQNASNVDMITKIKMHTDW